MLALCILNTSEEIIVPTTECEEPKRQVPSLPCILTRFSAELSPTHNIHIQLMRLHLLLLFTSVVPSL